eukprot:scaffold27087_cov74-Phaeocystis_antarctica.AAC.2
MVWYRSSSGRRTWYMVQGKQRSANMQALRVSNQANGHIRQRTPRACPTVRRHHGRGWAPGPSRSPQQATKRPSGRAAPPVQKRWTNSEAVDELQDRLADILVDVRLLLAELLEPCRCGQSVRPVGHLDELGRRAHLRYQLLERRDAARPVVLVGGALQKQHAHRRRQVEQAGGPLRVVAGLADVGLARADQWVAARDERGLHAELLQLVAVCAQRLGRHTVAEGGSRQEQL